MTTRLIPVLALVLMLLLPAHASPRVGRIALLGGGAAALDMVNGPHGRVARLTLADGERSYAFDFTPNQLLEVRDALFDALHVITHPEDRKSSYVECVTQAFGEPRQLHVRLSRDGKRAVLVGYPHGAEATRVEVEADAPRLVALKLLLEKGQDRLK